MAQVVTVRTNVESQGNMETIGERRAHARSTDLVVLKTEILAAFSSVGCATTIEELKQAYVAYKSALRTARSIGYRPHIRVADGQQIQVAWLALGKAPFRVADSNVARQTPMALQKGRRLNVTRNRI